MIATALDITYYKSPVGLLEIKADDEAIHAILFVNAWKGPKLEMEEIDSTISSGNRHVNNCIAQLQEYFEGKRKDFDFPFNQKGTVFQQKVWKALLDIPF